MEKQEENKLELLAAGLDLFLGVAGKLPVISSVNAVRKILEERKTDRTVKNLTAFLTAVGEHTKEQKEQFQKSLGDNPQEFYDNLLTAVEKLDRAEKGTILGKLQKGMIENQIEQRYFLKLAKVIELIHMTTLSWFLSVINTKAGHISNRSEYLEVYNELVGLGLFFTEIEQGDIDGGDASNMSLEKSILHQTYKHTDLGKLFVNVVVFGTRTPTDQQRQDWQSGKPESYWYGNK